MTWGSQRLRNLSNIRVSNVDKKSVDGEQGVRLCNYTDVYYNDRITTSLDFMKATASRVQAATFQLQQGDTLITKDSETADDIGVAAYVDEALPGVLCGYHLALIRPLSTVDPRFLNWALRSHFVREQWAISASGVTRFGLTYGAIKDVIVPFPPLDVQRRIADFLDDQVGLLDRLKERRYRQVSLEQERYAAGVVSLFSEEPQVPLRRTGARALVGIVVQPAALYSDDPDSVPALRGMDVREGAINTSPGVRISAAGNAANRCSQLAAGDVVVVRTGDAGAAAVVPVSADGWNAIDLVIVRAGRDALPAYLEAAINAARLDKSVSQHSAGSIQQHFGVNAVLGLPVPVLSVREQRVIVDQVADARQRRRRTVGALERSLSLLEERKRSLITAAVTGEFDVSTASSRATA